MPRNHTDVYMSRPVRLRTKLSESCPKYVPFSLNRPFSALRRSWKLIFGYVTDICMTFDFFEEKYFSIIYSRKNFG